MPTHSYQRYRTSGQRKWRNILICVEVLMFTTLMALAFLGKNTAKEFLKNQMLEKVRLEPDSEGFKNWRDPPIKTIRNYHLFNITNANDVVASPSLIEIQVKDTPAYSYEIKTNKVNPIWSNDKKSIRYGVERIYTRHPTLFNPSAVNHTGTFVDLLRATFRTKFGTKAAQSFYDIAGLNTFYERNAIEQLEGFTSELHSIMKDKMYGPNTEKSGFIYRQNGSILYNVSINTDSDKKGQILTFSSELVQFSISNVSSHYDFPIYDGLTYPPRLRTKKVLDIFNSDFCLPVRIEFNRNVSSFWWDLLEYKIKLMNCSNSSSCTETDKLDVSKCISSSLPENTFFLSKAHFYGSSNEDIQSMKIKGFTPNDDLKDSYIYFEPYTGTPVQAFFRLQLNIEAMIDPIVNSEPTNKKSHKRLIPVFWIDQRVDISDEIITRFKILHFIIRYMQPLLFALAILISFIFIFIVEISYRQCKRQSRYSYGYYS